MKNHQAIPRGARHQAGRSGGAVWRRAADCRQVGKRGRLSAEPDHARAGGLPWLLYQRPVRGRSGAGCCLILCPHYNTKGGTRP